MKMEAMKGYRARTAMMFAAVVALGMAAGCGQPAIKDEPKASKAPVTIKVSDSSFSKEQQNYISDAMGKKNPHITIEFVKMDADYEKLVATNSIPDILTANTIKMSQVIALDLAEELEPYLKRSNIDLNRFEDYVSNGSKTLAFPLYAGFTALYYNKDIFDKFGVSHPTDGMTWEQAIELGRKVTRNEEGTQYYGLGLMLERLAYALPAIQIDGITNRATINTDKWKMIYSMLNGNWSIPGMKAQGDSKFPNVENLFMKDRVMAMLPGQSYVLRNLQKPAEEGLNFDIAQLPSFSSSPNTFEWDNMSLVVVAKTSKHKEEAVQFLKIIATDEYQTLITEEGRLTALKNVDIKKKYGAQLPHLKGKNVAGIFKSRAAKPLPISLYYDQTRKYMNNAAADIVYGNKDINSALRDAEEQINKEVEALSKK